MALALAAKAGADRALRGLTSMPVPARYRTLPTLLLLVAAPTAALVVAACSSDATSAGNDKDGGADTGLSPEAAAAAKAAKDLFLAVQPDLVKTCGGANGVCHVSGTVSAASGQAAGKWLGPPDVYESARTYPGVIPADNILEHSNILSQIEHTGPALVNQKELFPRVQEWVKAEIAAVGTRLPVSAAFDVTVGFNSISLAEAAPGMDGAKLLFSASSSPAGLTLDQVRIVGATAKVLHIEDPFFNLLPKSGPARSDTTNGFVGKLDVAQGETKEFFAGVVILPKWTEGTKLQLAFKVLTVKDPGAAAQVGCKSVATFKSSATPIFKAAYVNVPVDDAGTSTTKKSCFSCHGGDNPIAVAAMDLSALDSAPDAACGQALVRVNLSDKTKSSILLSPTGQPGGNPNHRTMDPGDVAAFTAGIKGWTDNE
jgi:hypothetical protein